MPKPTQIAACENCGSANVVKDAWATWDPDALDWVIKDVFDHEWCEDCEDETRIDWVDQH